MSKLDKEQLRTIRDLQNCAKIAKDVFGVEKNEKAVAVTMEILDRMPAEDEHETPPEIWKLYADDLGTAVAAAKDVFGDTVDHEVVFTIFDLLYGVDDDDEDDK